MRPVTVHRRKGREESHSGEARVESRSCMLSSFLGKGVRAHALCRMTTRWRHSLLVRKGKFNILPKMSSECFIFLIDFNFQAE